MKILIFIVQSFFLALTCGVFVPPRPGHQKEYKLGEKECTYGPSYWCQNLTNAADCRATKHCIQTVWIHRQYPEDKTSICDTCKDMVKQARDQLESNETQELIKEVFEGSCALLRLKPVVKECDKIADDYIPELIDTLASQMNPQTVCAVAGLCNSPRVQELLAIAGEEISNKPSEVTPRNRCDDCNTVLDLLVSKFKRMSKDDFLESLLEVCGKLGSFSDACSNIVINNFSDMHSFLKENFNADDFCLLSGECYANFHKHEIEITPMSKIGYVPVAGDKEDLPCELCEQLITHLREVLVANTTEAEFKQVLEGICKQTKQSFRKECLNIVEQYYDIIYNYLVAGLNATATCQMINICPRNAKSRPMIAPLLPVDTAEVALQLSQEREHVYIPKDDIVVKVIQPKPETPILSAQEMQLPIDLLVPPHQQVYSQQFCVFCEYFLHYLQKAITDPRVEDEVEKVLDEACSKLPNSVNETCVEFINTYEPALVAILAQEIDPSQVCPLIKACPSEEVKDVEIFMHTKSSSSCPLCLYAVTELEDMVKGDKSKEKIKAALAKVCSRLPGNLKPECTDFVNTYTDELVEMLIADFKPQEVCVYLKLCTDATPVSEIELPENEYYGGDVETNVIYDDTVNGHPIENLGDEKCILCEFIMKEIDDQLKDKKTDDEIKTVVQGICKVLPGTIKDQCSKFVDQYADAIIILLQEAMEPQSICAYMKLCKRQQHPLEFLREEVSKCEVCRSAADIIQTILRNPKIEQSTDHIFEKTCRGMPSEMKKTCMATFFKDGEVDYTNVAKVFELIDEKSTIPNEQIDNVKLLDCLICKLVVKTVKAIVSNQHVSVAEVKMILETVCLKIPSWISSPCDDFVRKYFDQIAQLIVSVVDDGTICSMLMVCGTESLETNVIQETGVNEIIVSNGEDTQHFGNVENLDCALCKIIVKLTKEIVKNSYTKDKIKDALKKVCSKLHKESKKCRRFLDKYLDKIVDLLLNAATRDKVCKVLLICSVEPSKYAFDFDKYLVNYSNELGNDMCTPCKILGAVLKSVLENPDISRMVKTGIDDICDTMPEPIKTVCHSELTTHWNDWLNMIRKFDAEQFCKDANMCSTRRTSAINFEEFSIINTSNELVSGKDICAPCEILSDLVKSVLENLDVSKMMKEGKICDLISEPLKHVCHSELTRNGIDWINMLEAFNVKQVCGKTKMCSVWKELTNIDEKGICQSCVMVTRIIKTVLLVNPSVAQVIKNKILSECGEIFPAARAICKLAITTYWDKWLKIIKIYDAPRFCRYINMCSGRKEMQGIKDDDKIVGSTKCRNAARSIKYIVQYALVEVSDEPMVRRHCQERSTAEAKITCYKLLNQLGRPDVDYLVNVLRQLDEENICSNQRYDEVELLSNVNSPKCTSCKLIISTIRKVFKSELSKEEIKMHLLEACNELLTMSKTCKSLVELYSDVIIRMIGNHIDSKQICNAIHLCKENKLDYDEAIFTDELSEVDTVKENLVPQRDSKTLATVDTYN